MSISSAIYFFKQFIYSHFELRVLSFHYRLRAVGNFDIRFQLSIFQITAIR